MEKKKDCPNKLLTILMITCVTLSVVILGIISHDKFLKKEEKVVPSITVPESKPSHNCQKCQECEKCENKQCECDCPNCANSSLGEKVSSVKEIKLTHTNQEFKVGSKTYKIKIGTEEEEGQLSIDDYFVHYYLGSDNVHVDHAYLTDKFIFFTHIAQLGETLSYAIGENGEIVANHNGYYVYGGDSNNFKIVDGYLHATGREWCGMECDKPIKDLLVKYIDNTLIITEAK